MKSHWYPKSTIDIQNLLFSSGSSTGAQKARKLSGFSTEPEVGMEYWKEQEKKEEGERQAERKKRHERELYGRSKG